MDTGVAFVLAVVCLSQLIAIAKGQENTTWADVVIKARCLARCYDKYGTRLDIYEEQATSLSCKNNDCKQCTGPCNATLLSTSSCADFCLGNPVCHNSCIFRGNLEESSYMETSEGGPDKTVETTDDILLTPEVMCQNVPYNILCKHQSVASVYVKWGIKQVKSSETSLYIVTAHADESSFQGCDGDWSQISIERSTSIHFHGLACGTKYRYCVTPVSASGIKGQTVYSNWTSTPSDSLAMSPPTNVTLKSTGVVNQRPSAVISWDPGKDPSCYYKIYWMNSKVHEKEITAPNDFTFQIDHLDFSTSYKVLVFSYYDDKFTKSGKNDASFVFVTADCLTATTYNYTICVPMAPVNLSLSVLTPDFQNEDVTYINVSLQWEPPSFLSNVSDIVSYRLSYRKEPPINAAPYMEPHLGRQKLPPTDTEVTLYNLHNHNQYSFSLHAETRGGIGKPAGLTVFIGQTAEMFYGLTDIDESRLSGNVTGHQLGLSQVIAVVLVPLLLCSVFVAALVLIISRRRRKYRRYSAPRRFGPVEELNPIYEGMRSESQITDPLLQSEDEYEIDFSRLELITMIGEGAFGKVMKAELFPKNMDGERKGGKIVAVKMLKDFFTADESRNFLLEIKAMKSLGHHPNIVSIVGCCLKGPKTCLIMDLCALGDLRNYLRTYREKIMYGMSSPYGMMTKTPEACLRERQNSDSGVSQSSVATNVIEPRDEMEMSEAQLLSYARQVAMGMEFLESKKYVHRDLAARNILMFNHRHVKISDFGLSRDVYETNVYQPTSARKLPYKWMAIESLFSQRFTIKSDVWAFGIVLWEIVTLGGSPYPSIPMKDLYGLLNDGYRMEKPENCSTKVYEIMLSCWHPNPQNRPMFSQLKTDLERLLEETQSYIDLSVEVSEDYFNESTAESQVQEDGNTDDVDSSLSAIEGGIGRGLKSNDYFVDIHTDFCELKANRTINTEEKPPNEETCMLPKDDDNEELTLSESGQFCLFHLDNSKLNSSSDSQLPTKRCKCVLCTNRNSLPTARTACSKGPKPKNSFKNSFRNIMDRVGIAGTGVPKSKKRSASLIDMGNEKRVTFF